MNKSLLVTVIAGMLLSTVPAAAPVQAISAIQRCQSSDGTLVYTDKACALLDAKPVPMPGELMTRIVREEASAPASTEARYADADTPLDAADTSIAVSRRSPGSGCARTPTQLAMDLRGALGLGDVNRVAESYHWVGMSGAQGERTLDRLQRLIGRPVIESRYYNAQITSSPFSGEADAMTTATALDEGPGGAGILQLTLGSAASAAVIDFDVQRYAGCYFIEF
jgi:hypothetical protein